MIILRQRIYGDISGKFITRKDLQRARELHKGPEYEDNSDSAADKRIGDYYDKQNKNQKSKINTSTNQ